MVVQERNLKEQYDGLPIETIPTMNFMQITMKIPNATTCLLPTYKVWMSKARKMQNPSQSLIMDKLAKGLDNELIMGNP